MFTAALSRGNAHQRMVSVVSGSSSSGQTRAIYALCGKVNARASFGGINRDGSCERAYRFVHSVCGVRSPSLRSGSRRMSQQRRSITFRSVGTSDENEVNIHVRNLLHNNKKWVRQMQSEDPEFFDKLANIQKPKYLYIGCSDSRVPANQILGMSAGEVFVHRNVGNLLSGNDLNALSVLEYAIGHVGITDIIVAGHYDCGAVKAALSRQDLGILENWLRQIRDVHRLHKEYLDHIKNDEDRTQTLVELNVVEQCLNVYKTGIVQRTRRKQNHLPPHEITPRIYGMVFNPADGILKKLNIDFERRVGSLDHIYGLY